jgi:hypothetical protein
MCILSSENLTFAEDRMRGAGRGILGEDRLLLKNLTIQSKYVNFQLSGKFRP